ncbi:hypothetical protein [Kitasatospora sp. NPDC087315]|uniref:hypothetical protein n=1 Tax=Kitasatospora sp. NPDC087315 TaxID=3364069 RepID=UPI0038101D9A
MRHRTAGGDGERRDRPGLRTGGGVLVQASTVGNYTAGDQTFGDRITFNGAGGTYVQAGEQPVEIHHTFGDRPGRER